MLPTIADEASAGKPTCWSGMLAEALTHFAPSAAKPMRSLAEESAAMPMHLLVGLSAMKPMHLFAPVLMGRRIQEAYQDP